MIHINFLHHNSYKLTLPKIDYSKYQAQKTAFLLLVATGKTEKRSKIPSSVGSGHLGKLLCKGLVISKGDFKDIAMQKQQQQKEAVCRLDKCRLLICRDQKLAFYLIVYIS